MKTHCMFSIPRPRVSTGPFYGAPGRAHLLEDDSAMRRGSSLHARGEGSVSRTARVSTARWNLKEAVGKTLI